MSYSIRLENAGPVRPFILGSNLTAVPDENGNLVPVASTDPSIDITYNYSEFYYKTIDKEQGIRWLYGKTGRETLPALGNAVMELTINYSSDYWEKTAGNAGYALAHLLMWALQYPDGIWAGD